MKMIKTIIMSDQEKIEIAYNAGLITGNSKLVLKGIGNNGGKGSQ